ncbi:MULTISPECIES: hypothetical protein [unclassified Bradyrhizobium]
MSKIDTCLRAVGRLWLAGLRLAAGAHATDLPDGASPLDKNISLYPKDNSVYKSTHLARSRGASRSSRTRVEMRWTPIAQLTSAHEADGEIVQA